MHVGFLQSMCILCLKILFVSLFEDIFSLRVQCIQRIRGFSDHGLYKCTFYLLTYFVVVI